VFFIVVILSCQNVCFNAKSLKYQLKSSSVSNFFLFFLRAESRPESCLNGFIDMKTTRMKHYFNQNN